MQQHTEDGVAVDTTRDATDEINVWYANPTTGGTFGFGLPLPVSIPPQIAAGNLVRVDGPDGAPQAFALPESTADGSGSADFDPEDDPILHPCAECGTVAVKVGGAWTEHCAAHQPKPTGKPGGARAGK